MQVWIAPGLGLGGDFIAALSSLFGTANLLLHVLIVLSFSQVWIAPGLGLSSLFGTANLLLHVLIVLSFSQVWIAPGLGLGDDFIAALSSVSEDSSVVMLAILLVFAIAHSGLAFLRPYGALVHCDL